MADIPQNNPPIPELRDNPEAQQSPQSQDAQELADQYGQLSLVFLTLRLTQRSRGFGAHAQHLTSLASVSAFLASVQIGFIAFTSGAGQDRAANVGPGWSALNFFSFTSLFLDTFSAFFSLLFAQRLSKRLEVCHFLLDDKKGFDVEVAHFGTLLKNNETREAAEFLAKQRLRDRMEEFIDRLKALRDNEALHHPRAEERFVIATILASILFFAVGLVIFIRITQPKDVWLSTILISSFVAILLIYNDECSRFKDPLM